ncbi:MAG: dihydroorotate dehydrogenase B catalytic subunit [Spirochaetes bacterium GWB1_36_13]|nr:MAG: dihydroorotate dehydrogenase B catalytic subunit [Spirochaetes bacterium GWB1_36_13]
MPDLKVKIKDLEFQNPILTASGTYGYGLEFLQYYDVNLLGGITLKGLSLSPKKGNLVPRIAETYGGMLNSIGLENVGFDVFVKEKLPEIQKSIHNVVIANVFGNTVEDYEEIALKIDDLEGIKAIELNISCPNVKAGGIAFGQDSCTAGNLLSRVRKKVKNKVLIAKLSPNVTDIKEFAKVCESEGMDAVSLINTLRGMRIDLKKGKPVLANKIGGLSGPAVKPVAIRMVYECAQSIRIPIIGMGGIMTGEDAAEFLMAGASLVAVGSGNLINPYTSLKVLNELTDYLSNNNIKSLKDMIGKAL